MAGKMSRRKFLEGSAIGALGVAAPVLAGPTAISRKNPANAMQTVSQLTLTEIAGRLQRGELTAGVVADAVIAAANAHPELNAYTAFDETQLRRAAAIADSQAERGERLGPLHGVPLILKDNINTRALPTSGGTPAFAHHRPATDAPVAARLFGAGALLAGKANLHELSAGGTSNNHRFGAVGNPYDVSRVPGGSSGGTAAAVSSRLVPGGLGTDTAGSVRVPAALCGVVGLRPTTGRYPAGGIIPVSATLDTAGPIARRVDDIVLLDAVLSGDTSGPAAQLPANVRLGLPEAMLEASSAAVLGAMRAALERLQAAGIRVVPVDLASIRKTTGKASGALIGFESRDAMQAYLDAHAPELTVDDVTAQIASPAARRLFQGGTRTAVQKENHREVLEVHLPELQRQYRDLYREFDIAGLIYPTTPEVALPRDEDDSVIRDGESAFSWFYFSNTVLASVASNPSLTLPAGLSPDGLPVGLSVDALPGQDRRLLALGRLIESILPGIPAPVLD